MSTVYQIRVSLNYIRPEIWRRLLVPDDVLLSYLHNILQTAMGWTNSHLHQFIVNRNFYEPPAPDDMQIDSWGTPYTGMTLNEFLTDENDTIEYEYDFGDGWVHEIKLEKIIDAGSESEYEYKEEDLPVCIDGENACPPEDCGGPPGYQELQKVLDNPDHPDYNHYKNWFGSNFDPAHFNLKGVNNLLQKDN